MSSTRPGRAARNTQARAVAKPVVVFEEPRCSFRGYVPESPLDRDVSLVWMNYGVPANARERVLPNGAIEVILNFGARHRVLSAAGSDRVATYEHAWIAGIQSRYLDIESDQDSRRVGIRFRPGGVAGLLPVAMDALRDQVIDLELVARELSRELHGRRLIAIDAGYHVVSYAVMGVILGAWS